MHGALRGAEEKKFIDNQTCRRAARSAPRTTRGWRRCACLRGPPAVAAPRCALWTAAWTALTSSTTRSRARRASARLERRPQARRLRRDRAHGSRRQLPCAARLLTSCADAVMRWPDDKPEGECFDEDDWDVWSAPDGAEPDARRHAKVAAEREAWRLADERNVSLAVVNPAFMVGPARTRATPTAPACGTFARCSRAGWRRRSATFPWST